MNAAIQATWQTELMARHPELFKQELCGRVIKPGYPTVGDGLRDLVETAVRRIAVAPSGSVKVRQITEKCGTLRMYLDSGRSCQDPINAAIDEAIELAEARSACTCEACGCEGRLFKHGGWPHTACDYHGRGHPVPQKPGLENVHIVWGVSGGKRVLCTKRYVRATDTFEEIDPSTLNLDDV
jgi:hypothetical protein